MEELQRWLEAGDRGDTHRFAHPCYLLDTSRAWMGKLCKFRVTKTVAGGVDASDDVLFPFMCRMVVLIDSKDDMLSARDGLIIRV